MTILLEPFEVHLRAESKSPATIAKRISFLARADRRRDILTRGIDQASTNEWKRLLAANPKWTRWTRATNYGHGKSFYEWATGGDDPPLTYNPFTHIKRPPGGHGIADPVTDDQLAHALAASDDWWRFVIILASEAGLRVGEIVRLRREDVTPERIRIRHSKGDRSRDVPTSPDIWRLVQGCGPGALVRSPVRGVPISPGQLSCLARRHFDAIDQPDVHMHRFRKWFATWLSRSGEEITVISDLLGHASLRTTAEIYVRVTGEQRIDAIATLPTLLDGNSPESPSTGHGDMINLNRRISATVTTRPLPIGDLRRVVHR